MRLLLINYEYPPLGGGAGNATKNIARELAALGHEVEVLTSSFKGLPAREDHDGYKVRRLPVLRRYEDRCSRIEMAVFMAVSSLGVLTRRGARRPDAAIAFFGMPGGPAAWVLKALRNVPYVVSLRGGDVPGFQPYDLATMHRLTRPAIRFFWRQAKAVVANSRGLKDLAMKSAPDGVAVQVIPNGVDTRCFSPSEGSEDEEDARLRTQRTRLLFVGRVVFQKGLDILMSALAELPHSARWNLTIVGDGGDRDSLEEQAQALGISGRIHFEGWRSKENICQAYRDADVFVLPSRDEGMPNAVLEAMSSGLPVIATRIAGSEELIEDGRSGLLVEPESVAELSASLAKLIDDPVWRRKMGRRGRERVEAEYTWRSVAEAYAELLKPETAPTRQS